MEKRLRRREKSGTRDGGNAERGILGKGGGAKKVFLVGNWSEVKVYALSKKKIEDECVEGGGGEKSGSYTKSPRI